ncbi:hypothetical protein JW964_15515 [candidate division KSB1 bacterium]|nr:hypothetical protein [candidate division KSB1 bacterium]
MNFNKLFIVFSILFSILMQNCGIFHKDVKPDIVPRSVLPGIDPKVYILANAKADTLIPSKEKEAEAADLVQIGQKDLEISESLWRAVEIFRERVEKDSLKQPTRIVKEQIEVSDDENTTVYLRTDSTKIKKEVALKDSLTEPILKQLARLYLDNSMKYFLQAKEINRFNLNTITQVANLFNQKAERYQDSTSSKSSIEQYQYIARYQKGYHYLFARLGENYEKIGDWESALKNYKEALRVFLATSGLKFATDANVARQDSIEENRQLVQYWVARAYAETRLFMADSAMVSWLNAHLYADEPARIDEIEGNIKNIMWDSLNIKAFTMRDSIERVYKKGKEDVLRAGYLALLKIIKTQKARDEIESIIAEIDFASEDDAVKQSAIQRIVNIVRRADANPATRDKFEAPIRYDIIYYLELDSLNSSRFIVHNDLRYSNRLIDLLENNKLKVDSTYKKIFRSAGSMCFQYGQEKMDQGLYDDAHLYLNRSNGIDWHGRYKSSFILARFYGQRLNPRRALQHCYEIAAAHEYMSFEEHRDFLLLMSRLFRNRLIDKVHLAQEVYQIYNIFINGGEIPWADIFSYLEPYRG